MSIYELLDDVTEWLASRTSYVVTEDMDAVNDDFAYVRYYPVDYALQNEAFDFEKELQRMYPEFRIKFGYQTGDVLTLEVD